MKWSSFPKVVLWTGAMGALGCGPARARAPLCGQEGVVCELVDTSGSGTAASEGTGGNGTASATASADSGEADLGETGSAGTSGTGDPLDSGSDDTTGGVDLTNPPPGFPVPEPFGDSVLETDLIGTWTLPTDGAPVGYAMSFAITDEGRFEWREYDDVCALTQYGAGWIWVEGSQLVMVFGTWTGAAPWPVQAKYGWAAEAPFMIRAGYAPIAGHIAVTLPPSVRNAQTWGGRGYARTVGGATVQDIWITETELWARPPGSPEADIIARDRTTLDLSAPAVGDTTFQRWWFENGKIDPDVAVTTPVDYSEDGQANAIIAGAAHVYLTNDLATFAPGEVFLLGGEILCE